MMNDLKKAEEDSTTEHADNYLLTLEELTDQLGVLAALTQEAAIAQAKAVGGYRQAAAMEAQKRVAEKKKQYMDAAKDAPDGQKLSESDALALAQRDVTNEERSAAMIARNPKRWERAQKQVQGMVSSGRWDDVGKLASGEGMLPGRSLRDVSTPIRPQGLNDVSAVKKNPVSVQTAQPEKDKHSGSMLEYLKQMAEELTTLSKGVQKLVIV